MTMRWGLGPVFAFEWLTTSRRWQVYALRSLFVGILLSGMAVTWWGEVKGRSFTSIRDLSQVGETFYSVIATVQLALVLLVAPAATAGAVCLDKARGTLEHLLVTDLSDAEIILGKLGVRLVPVVGFVACALPVMAVGTLLGGIDPMALTGAFLVTLGVAVMSCALALTLSVWGRKTHEVLMGTYVVLILWLLLVPVGAWLAWSLGGSPTAQMWWEGTKATNPFYVIVAPYADPGEVTLVTHAAFLVGCLLVAAALALLAVVRVRGVALAQAGRGATAPRPRLERRSVSRPRVSWRRGPSLDDNPVLWREWHRKRPSGWTRAIWGTYGILSLGFTLIALLSWARRTAGPGDDGLVIINAVEVVVGLLLLSVSAATSLAEERARGSLDVLLATPLSTRTILWGKWYGAFRPIPGLALLPVGAAFCLALSSGNVLSVLVLFGLLLAYGAVISSLGLALATWISRLGRAIAATVAIYVVFTVAWIVIIAVLFPRGDDAVGAGLAMGSPFLGTVFGTVGAGDRRFGPGGLRDTVALWTGFWAVAHAALAAALFLATVRTFDHCLGRMPEMPDEAVPPKVAPHKPERLRELV